MTLDTDTLLLILGLTATLQAVALFLQRRSVRAFPGQTWWASSSALFAAGFLISMLRGSAVLGSTAVFLSAMSLTGAMVCIHLGASGFVGRRPARLVLGMVVAAALVAQAYFAFWSPIPALGSAALLVAMAVLAFMSAHPTFVYRVSQVAQISTAIASTLLAYGLVLLVLAISLLIVPTTHSSWPEHADAAMALSTLVSSTLWAFAVLLMVDQRANAELRESRDEHEQMFRAIPDASLINRLSDGAYVQVSDAFTALTGLTRSDVIDRYTPRIDIWNDQADRRRVVTALRVQSSLTNLDVTFKRGNGRTFTGSLSARLVDLRGEPHLVSLIRAERPPMVEQDTATTVSDEANRLTALLSNEVIWTCTPARLFAYVSPSAATLFGMTIEDLIGRPLDALLTPVANGTLHDAMDAMLQEVARGDSPAVRGFELEQPTREGKTLWTETRLQLRCDEFGEPAEFVALMRDVTEQKRLREELQRQTTADELTGWHNRRHFLTLARQELKRAIRRRRALSLALIDVDRFRLLNETYGHAAGDQALLALTRLCRSNLRSIDIVARFGGDQFAILLPESTRQEAARALERIRATLEEEPVVLEGQRIAMSVSAGIASLEDGENSLDGLLRRADLALFQMKRAGRNRVGFSQDPL